MADLRRTSLRLGLGLALAAVGLFEILSLLQGVRSVRKAAALHDAEERVLAAGPRGRRRARGGGAPAWDAAATLALSLGLANEVDGAGPHGGASSLAL